MRRPTLIALGILMIALIGLLFAAQMALGPFQDDAEVAKEIRTRLEQNGKIARGSALTAIDREASDETLAKTGRGLIIAFTPHDDFRSPTSLDATTREILVAVKRLRSEQRRRADWVELHVRLQGPGGPAFRTLAVRRDTGEFGDVQPPFPRAE